MATTPPRKVALVANCLTDPHDPAEVGRLESDATEIPYQWPTR